MEHRDIALIDTARGADIAIENGDIKLTGTIDAAARVSILADARADERLPDNPRGWWSAPLGSLIWLYKREKATAAAAHKIETAARDALQWALDTGEATAITAAARFIAPDKIALDITIDTPEGTIRETFNR